MSEPMGITYASRFSPTSRALVRNWWMMAVRGVLAIAFGGALLLWPGVTLSIVVLLFGIYAIVDGGWSIAAANRASTRLAQTWPVMLEGIASVAIGVLALVWPFMPRSFVYLLVFWGMLTGILELTAAIRLPLQRAASCVLGTAGVSSLVLALFLFLLTHADDDAVVRIMATYAQVFGVTTLLAATLFSRAGSRHGRAIAPYTGPSR
jgi:uncharacterized membrane protein HdeD (DUF308 family)